MAKKDRDALIPEILGHVQAGLSIKDACNLAGVSTRAFQLWRKNDPVVVALLKKSELKAKLLHIGKINAAPDWQASAWFLERKYPQEFGRKTIIVNPPKTTEDTGILVRVPQPKPKAIESTVTDV